jgi:hypothetical protein
LFEVVDRLEEELDDMFGENVGHPNVEPEVGTALGAADAMQQFLAQVENLISIAEDIFPDRSQD